MDEIAEEFTRLLVSFPQQGLSEQAARARAQSYFIALEGLPAWAVKGACRQWLRGEVEGANLAFAPSPPQLRKLADALLRPVQAHGIRLGILLNAEVEAELPPPDREAMQKRIDGLMKTISGRARSEKDRSIAYKDSE